MPRYRNEERAAEAIAEALSEAAGRTSICAVAEAIVPALRDLTANETGGRRGRTPPVVLRGIENERDRDGPGPRPKRSEFRSKAAHRTALKRWHRKRAEREGPATRRGRTPPIVTAGPDED